MLYASSFLKSEAAHLVQFAGANNLARGGSAAQLRLRTIDDAARYNARTDTIAELEDNA
jgi:hypothetical protein